MRKHGALLFLRPSPLTGALRAPPHRTGALRAPRASRFARIDGRRLTPCGAKRRAASAGGLRGAASGALRLSFSPLCGLFRAHRREVESVRLAVCSWRPAAAAAGVRPSFGRPRQTAAYPATRNRSSRAVVGRGIGRPRRARLLSAFPAAAAPGKSLLLDPAPASGIPPAHPVGGLVAGGVGRPRPGKTLVARGASPAEPGAERRYGALRSRAGLGLPRPGVAVLRRPRSGGRAIRGRLAPVPPCRCR
mgnify:CR=1 FL=1